MRKNIPVQQLAPGMKIVALDIGWDKSPKWTSPFVLSSGDDLALLLQHCRIVSVETEPETPSLTESDGAKSQTKETHKAAPTESNTTSASTHSERSSPMPSASADHSTSSATAPPDKAQQARPRKQKTLRDKVPKQFVIRSFHECLDLLHNTFDQVRRGYPLDNVPINATSQKLMIAGIARPETLSLMSQLEERDNSLERKSLDVAVLSLCFARKLGFSKERLHRLCMAALLHDIGMTRIPPALLNQRETLSEKQRSGIQKHVRIGCKLLHQSDALRPLNKIIAYHHERYDGKGYPMGIKGSKIPLEGRILAITTAFEAMTRNRHFSSQDTPTQALRKLFQSRNKHFDGALVERFIRSVGVYPVGTLVELNARQIGMITDVTTAARSRPVVHTLYDRQGRQLENPHPVDLSQRRYHGVKITRAVKPEEIENLDLQALANQLKLNRVA